MKKPLIIIVILLILSSSAFAKLSDKTLEIVEKLRFKHYMYMLPVVDYLEWSDITWTSDFLSIKVKGDKIIIETQDGKWFIKMEKVIE